MAESLPSNIVSGVPGTASSLDWDVSLDAPLVDIAAASSILSALGTEYIHLRWHVTNVADGASITLTNNASVVSLEMAITHSLPGGGDWLAATLITRVAGDSTDGEYSILKVGIGQLLTLTAGTWRVWGRLTTTGEVIEQQAPGYLTVR